MSWEKELQELALRKELAARMGGEAKVRRHRENGKLPVRERIDKMVDPESFREVGILAGSGDYDAQGRLADFTPSNLLIGRAKVQGRPVVIAADDFTVRGGANDGAVGDKLVESERMAQDLRLPLIRLVDGTGGGGSVRNIEIKGHTLLPKLRMWPLMAQNLATVPVASLALGSVAGLGAARVAASHYSVMVRDTSQLFIAGPPVVARIGQNLDKNELGGSDIHTRNGVVDDEADSEEDAFAKVRRFLSYLPRSVHELPPRAAEPGRAGAQEWLRDAIPADTRAVYKMRPILETLVDEGSFMEIGKRWGRAIITGLARIDGWPVAVFGSDPYHYGGGWDGPAAEKFTRLLDLAETFHLPVINLVDVPGFQIGLNAEKAGAMRYGVRALTAVAQSTVRGARSSCARLRRGGGRASERGPLQLPLRLAVRPMGLAAGGGRAGGGLQGRDRSRRGPAGQDARDRARVRSLTSPFRSAEAFVVEDIIDPATTRRALEEFVELAAPLREPGPRAFGYRP